MIDHFTVACLVTWPLNESEAGVDLALIEISLLFSYIYESQVDYCTSDKTKLKCIFLTIFRLANTSFHPV